MKQTVIGLVVGVAIGAGAMWAFGGKKAPEGPLAVAPAKVPEYPVLLAYDSTRGSDPGSTPHFQTPALPAGSSIVFTCANNNCGSVSGAAGSGTSTAGSPVLFVASIPYELPANTQLSMSYKLSPAKK